MRPLVLLIKVRQCVSFRFQDTGVTPLMLAVRENRLVIAERLIDLGANVNDVAKVST